METKKSLLITAMAVTAIMIIEGCSKSSNGYTNTPAPPVAPTGIALGTSATLGSYLTDNQNHALYFFSNDANGQDSCTGGCAALWPPFNFSQAGSRQSGCRSEFVRLRFGYFTCRENLSSPTKAGHYILMHRHRMAPIRLRLRVSPAGMVSEACGL